MSEKTPREPIKRPSWYYALQGPLRTCSQAFYFVGHDKNGISALGLIRYLLLCRSPVGLDVSYRTGWLSYHKIMKAIEMHEAAYVLTGSVRLNDAYLGRERCGGTAGRGSENKLPIVAAVSIGSQGHPLRAMLSPTYGFTSETIGE